MSDVTNLKDMARLCDYGHCRIRPLLNELCGKMREKLLLESDNLSLGRALEIALRLEAAVERTTLLAGGVRCLPDIPAQQPQPAYHAHYCAHSADDSQYSGGGFSRAAHTEAEQQA